jgi:uncharacterized protein YfaS (alpha-2-macroglobulin family)
MFIRLIALLLTLMLPETAAPPATYTSLRDRAEASYAEKSFAEAHRLYVQASQLTLSPAERRWTTFRVADTRWRMDDDDSAAATAANDALNELIRGTEHDRVWAEANESSGDLETNENDSGAANPKHLAALAWWGESNDIPLARQRYLQLVFKMETPPRDVIVNALNIATGAEDVAHVRFILAQQLFNERKPESIERGLELLDQIIVQRKETTWYDDALYTAAEQITVGGNVVVADRDAATKPDYTKALDYFTRITTEFHADETPWHDRAQSGIDRLTTPQVNIDTESDFLPDTEQELFVSSRNVDAIELSIAKIDLLHDLQLQQQDGRTVSMLPEHPASVLRQWTVKASDNGPHAPAADRVKISPRLASGAYVVYASANGTSTRGLLIVGDLHVVAHSVGRQTAVYVSDAMRGAPVAGAHVRTWDGKRTIDATTDANGLAHIEYTGNNNQRYWGQIVASAGDRQAWVATFNYWFSRAGEQWRIYAFTDRPAYRPGETVHWKAIARTRIADEPFHTPAKQLLKYALYDGRNQKVAGGTATLNEFGSMWADLPITSDMALGQYRVTFSAGDLDVGNAFLFQVEEYKLPEYKVEVTTPAQYRLGDTVEAVVDARYYFGGAVGSAAVKVTVTQSPYSPWWFADEWYDFAPRQPNGGQNILEQTLKTDADGRARLHFDTSPENGDSNFTINACVTDESRREVCASTDVVVMKQSYRVAAKPQHTIGRPGEPIAVDFRATDSKQQGVKTAGKVRVTRRHWEEKAYRDDEVLTADVATNERGEATFTFTPQRDGYYNVAWSSEDRRADRPLRERDIVKTETALWISSRATTELGYHAGGLELVVDRDVLHAGERVPLIITTQNSGRWVLLTTSGSGLIDAQVVHLDGTVKLVELPVDERHVPDFEITASSVSDRAVSTATKVIRVPPEDRLLTVEVKPDRDEYKPRQSGTLTVTTHDSAGKPVAAEVALSVSDESVTAIASDVSGDIRRTFYNESRRTPVNVNASWHAQQLQSEQYVINGVESLPYFEVDIAKPATVAQAITVSAGAPASKAFFGYADVQEMRQLAQSVVVVVRSDFRSTAFWKPDVVTDANGSATVTFDYPEALTQWRTTARAVTADSKVGMASAMARTNQPLIVRLQAPRFFVAGDRSTVSAVINNNTDAAVSVTPSLEATGVHVLSDARPVDVPARGEARADWTIAAEQPGAAKLRVSGRSLSEGDGMEKSFPVYEHGIDKLVAKSGRIRESGDIHLELPGARRDTSLTVRVTPSLAGALFDALPYLIDYPYGCTEQTMSRFLPAAIVARVKSARQPAKLPDVTKQSLRRLYDFQHDDGGWGWWKDDRSQSFMTAYVLWGFAVAKEGGIAIDEESADRGVKWLDDHLAESENDPSEQAWSLHALGAWQRVTQAEVTEPERRAFDSVWSRREKLSAYSRALLALAAHDFGDKARADVLVRNLENGVRIDGDTAHWGADDFWWHWYDGPVETTSFVLQALVQIDPQNKLVEPAMLWLVKNRRGARWNNTRDTAIAILALTDYLRVSGELAEPARYELTVNGQAIGSKSEAATFTIDPALVKDGNDVTIRRTSGHGPLYYSIEGRFVSLEEPVAAAGHELFVKRDYMRLVPKPTLLHGVTYDKVPLRDGESLASGDRVEVVLTIETKNDYEYLLFEDLKPAGLEAVSQTSGAMFATSAEHGSTYVYQELRDRKVALFADELAQGTWTIRYELRAETPGSFHALPVLGEAMYVPEIRANGEETHVIIK